jgi:mRNA-degrading endonuclease RelE of RelBE toxin-antitoxin system
MRVLTTPRFDRVVKKLHAEEKRTLDQAVRSVIAAPASGEFKKGDLAHVRVHKYRFNKEQMLLAYAANLDQQVIILMGYGTHENFYRDLKH